MAHVCLYYLIFVCIIVDDDMRVPCTELDFAFDVWRGSQQSIVGFMPRVHLRDASGALTYRAWWKVWLTGSYSIVLTKAAFLHHKYFQMYFDRMPPAILAHIDSKRNCEDIAMQFLVSNYTDLPPVFVKGHLTDLGVFGGISTSQNMKRIQSNGELPRGNVILRTLSS